jgi:hypothetical protein
LRASSVFLPGRRIRQSKYAAKRLVSGRFRNRDRSAVARLLQGQEL